MCFLLDKMELEKIYVGVERNMGYLHVSLQDYEDWQYEHDEAIAKAQAYKLVEWLEGTCDNPEHPAKGIARRSCRHCRQELKKEGE